MKAARIDEAEQNRLDRKSKPLRDTIGEWARNFGWGHGGGWDDCGQYEFYKDDRLRWQDYPVCSTHGRVLQLPVAATGVYR